MANIQTYRYERRVLQILIFIGAWVPVLAGARGVIWGTNMFAQSLDISLDSHFRYLSGILFSMGLVFWALIPNIEKKTKQVRLLTALVATGGLARLAAAVFVGTPSTPMVLAIAMELIVTPLLCLWQFRISRLYDLFHRVPQ